MSTIFGKNIVFPDTRDIKDPDTRKWAKSFILALDIIFRNISTEFNRFALFENDLYLSDTWRFTISDNNCELQEYVGATWLTRAKWIGS